MNEKRRNAIPPKILTAHALTYWDTGRPQSIMLKNLPKMLWGISQKIPLLCSDSFLIPAAPNFYLLLPPLTWSANCQSCVNK